MCRFTSLYFRETLLRYICRDLKNFPVYFVKATHTCNPKNIREACLYKKFYKNLDTFLCKNSVQYVCGHFV